MELNPTIFCCMVGPAVSPWRENKFLKSGKKYLRQDLSHVTVLYTEYVKELGGILINFVLYPCTIPP